MIRRGPRERHYTIIPNATLRDTRLTPAAWGIHHYILSHPDDWTVSIDRLATVIKAGREAIASAMRELETCGYVLRVRTQGPDGLWRTDTVVYDSPQDHAVQVAAARQGDKAAKAAVKRSPADKQPAKDESGEKRYHDRDTAIASRLVDEAYTPRLKHKVAQRTIAVIKIAATALSAGIPEGDVAAGLTALAESGAVVTQTSLTNAINGPAGKPARGRLAADERWTDADHAAGLAASNNRTPF